MCFAVHSQTWKKGATWATHGPGNISGFILSIKSHNMSISSSNQTLWCHNKYIRGRCVFERLIRMIILAFGWCFEHFCHKILRKFIFIYDRVAELEWHFFMSVDTESLIVISPSFQPIGEKQQKRILDLVRILIFVLAFLGPSVCVSWPLLHILVCPSVLQ